MQSVCHVCSIESKQHTPVFDLHEVAENGVASAAVHKVSLRCQKLLTVDGPVLLNEILQQ